MCNFAVKKKEALLPSKVEIGARFAPPLVFEIILLTTLPKNGEYNRTTMSEYMNNIQKLSKLMTLDADANTSEIEEHFKLIAKMLFEKFAIKQGEILYYFKEIEFFFYNKNHRDIITHPRISKPLCWYVNDFGGIDLNFASNIAREGRLNSKGKYVVKYVLDDSAYFGGILIRQLVRKNSGDILKGPLACAELFRSYDAMGVNMNKDLPILYESDNGKTGIENITTKSRVNILSKPNELDNKVKKILYEYHKHIQPSQETLCHDFANFKDKPYRYEKR